MKRRSPPVQSFMSRLPVEVDLHTSVKNTLDLMDEHKVRHVPVMKGSHLVGIVSLHDVERTLARRGNTGAKLEVGEICSTDLVTVGPLTSTAEASAKMLERSVGSAVVLDGGVIVGIYTSTDALRVVVELFL